MAAAASRTINELNTSAARQSAGPSSFGTKEVASESNSAFTSDFIKRLSSLMNGLSRHKLDKELNEGPRRAWIRGKALFVNSGEISLRQRGPAPRCPPILGRFKSLGHPPDEKTCRLSLFATDGRCSI